MPSLSNRWVVLALLFLVRFSIPVQFQSVAAVAPFMIDELGLTHTQIGMLLGLFFLPGVFISLPGGMLSSRFGGKVVMAGGLVLMAMGGLVLPFGSSYAMMFASRLLAGIGAVVANMMVTKLVTDWFVGKELSTALSIAAASFGLGVGVAVGTLGGLAEISSWRFALHSTTALTMCSLVLVLWLYKDLPISDAPTEKSRPGLWHLSGRELILVAIAGLAQIGFVAGYVVFMSFAPTLLIERGYSIAQAGSLVGLAALVAIVSVPLGGFLTDYTGKANLFVSGGAIGTALTCLMLVASGSPLVWILLFGLMRGGCTGGIQSMPGQILRPESRGTGFGVYFTVHYLGLALLPSVAGRLLDTTGGATASLLFAGLIWLIILPSLLVFRLLQNRWSPRVVN